MATTLTVGFKPNERMGHSTFSLLSVFFKARQPQVGYEFFEITLRRTTVGRTPLDE